ncbi:MAG: hypothetical protein ACRCX5_05305 [Bacteroidales bacterium]
MKRIISMLTIMLVILASCTTNESRIKREFNKHVENNFDNPKSVKELVSIEFVNRTNTDTLTQLIQSFTDVVNAQYLKDSVLIKKYTSSEKIDIISRNMRYVSALSRHRYISGMKKWGEFLSGDYANYYSLREYNKQTIANDSICQPFDVSVYKIKFRQKYGDELVLREYYAIFDNLKEKDNIVIQEANMRDNQYPEWFITCGKSCETMVKLRDRYESVREDIEKAFFDIKLELEDNYIYF